MTEVRRRIGLRRAEAVKSKTSPRIGTHAGRCLPMQTQQTSWHYYIRSRQKAPTHARCMTSGHQQNHRGKDHARWMPQLKGYPARRSAACPRSSGGGSSQSARHRRRQLPRHQLPGWAIGERRSSRGVVVPEKLEGEMVALAIFEGLTSSEQKPSAPGSRRATPDKLR